MTKGGFVLAGSAPKYPEDSHQAYHLRCEKSRHAIQQGVTDGTNSKLENVYAVLQKLCEFIFKMIYAVFKECLCSLEKSCKIFKNINALQKNIAKKISCISKQYSWHS